MKDLQNRRPTGQQRVIFNKTPTDADALAAQSPTMTLTASRILPGGYSNTRISATFSSGTTFLIAFVILLLRIQHTAPSPPAPATVTPTHRPYC